MNQTTATLIIRLIDLALAGGEYAARAIAAKDELKAMMARGGPTDEDLANLNSKTDSLLASLKGHTSTPS